MLSLLAAIQVLSPLQELRTGLLQDADVLKSAYTQMHPGLYRYNSPKAIDEKFAQLRTRFAQAKDLREAYVDLSLFTASIRCGHTYPNFFNQKKAIVQEVFSGQNRVPFYFKGLNRKMIVGMKTSAERSRFAWRLVCLRNNPTLTTAP